MATDEQWKRCSCRKPHQSNRSKVGGGGGGRQTWHRLVEESSRIPDAIAEVAGALERCYKIHIKIDILEHLDK